jgi:thiosulfate reductase cytochrome b subunit
MAATRKEFHHPFIIRATHWINVAALALMVASGLRIYNASPVFSFRIPDVLTLGGWLAGARQWHFFAMWLFFANGAVWLCYNLLTRHGRQTTLFRPSDARGIGPMVGYYLGVRKEHPPVKKYNALQKLAYTGIAFVGLVMILTGIAIYWPVQYSVLTSIFGGYDTARVWHFLSMTAILLFVLGHLGMVLLAGWWNFWSMITGWKRVRE